MLDRSVDHPGDTAVAATPHSVAIPLNDVSAADLQREVERQHGCKAVLIATEPVTETLAGNTVWQGDVHHFVLCGHPTADMAYAWSSSRDGGATRRIVAVLRLPPVNSAQSAVTTSIAQDQKASRPPA
jgi:hypothetical protein